MSPFLNFISFLNVYGSTEALEFAQTKLTPFGKVQKYVEKLEVCFFLMQNLRIITVLFIFVVFPYSSTRMNTVYFTIGFYGSACL